MKHLAIFASGNGTNCENIINYFADSDIADIKLVLSNKSTAPVVENSQRLGINTVVVPKKDFNDENILMPILKENDIDFIILSGFLLFIPDFLINHFNKRIINIHPAITEIRRSGNVWYSCARSSQNCQRERNRNDGTLGN